ncbi:MAG: cytochrome-c peroxidase [Bacteroidia bacterium]
MICKINFKVLFYALLFALGSCSKQEDKLTEKLDVILPQHFPKLYYKNDKNVVDEKKFNLGKKLFFDPILSVNNTISCASCHAPEHAFADHNTALSFGVFNRIGKRNSPALFNLGWQTSFNWDGGVNHIEVFPIAPITNQNEMGEDLKNLLSKLNNNKQYSNLFKEAFGVGKIEDREFLYALTQYMIMLVSYQSKYDDVVNGKQQFTESESRGYQIFKTHCNNCHTEPLFTDYSYKNNGSTLNNGEVGRMNITQKQTDKGKFKVPSLRNLELTYPYMHNGSIRTLEEVLMHYEKDKTEIENIDNKLKNGIKLSDSEKVDLTAFLKTLTDYKFITKNLYKK